jgi:hypothetical protein
MRASVPRIIFFGPAVPLHYSSAGFGPSNHFIRASNAFILFECGRYCPSNCFFGLATPWYYSSTGVIVPQIAFFGPAAPPYSLSAGFGPSNYFLRASSASTLFECGFPIPRITSSGHQCFHSIWIQTAVLRISISGYQCSPLIFPESWWQYTSSDAVCQIRR